MKSTLIALSIALTLVSCGRRDEIIFEPVYVASAPSSQDVDAQDLINEENASRLAQGQTALSSGLSCNLQTFTGGDRIQASIADHNTLSGLTNVGSFLLAGGFNQEQSSVDVGMNVLPGSIKNVYKTMYLLRCTGYIVVTENQYHSFELTSDDASVMYVDGAKVIDNDNAHATTDKVAVKYLKRGVHSFRLDYAQNYGEQSLVLKMNEEVFTADMLAH